MNEFLLFLKEHWRILAEIVFGLIVIIVTCFKKKVKVIDVVRSFICELLPSCIDQAEAKYGPGTGEEKKPYVIQLIVKSLAKSLGIDEYEIFKLYHKFIEKMLEDILSTPQKKKKGD